MDGERVSLGENLEYGLAKYAVSDSKAQGPAKHAVHLEFERGIRGIGIGPITGSIIKAVVEYGGQEVTEVPEGEDFKIAITYSASNPGYSWSPADPGWLITMTAMSTDETISGYEHANITKANVSSALDRIEPLGPMPAHDITLRINLWGNQDILVVPPCPPQADWLNIS